MNINRSTLNMIVSEKIDPSLRRAFAVAHFLGYKIDDLFFPTEKRMFKNIRKEEKEQGL